MIRNVLATFEAANLRSYVDYLHIEHVVVPDLFLVILLRVSELLCLNKIIEASSLDMGTEDFTGPRPSASVLTSLPRLLLFVRS